MTRRAVVPSAIPVAASVPRGNSALHRAHTAFLPSTNGCQPSTSSNDGGRGSTAGLAADLLLYGVSPPRPDGLGGLWSLYGVSPPRPDGLGGLRSSPRAARAIAWPS